MLPWNTPCFLQCVFTWMLSCLYVHAHFSLEKKSHRKTLFLFKIDIKLSHFSQERRVPSCGPIVQFAAGIWPHRGFIQHWCHEETSSVTQIPRTLKAPKVELTWNELRTCPWSWQICGRRISSLSWLDSVLICQIYISALQRKKFSSG